MNENVDKQLDELSKKVLLKTKVEQPSFDFTNNVMSKIESFSASGITTYEPLISKRSWILMGIALMSICGFAFFGTFDAKDSWLDALGLDRFLEFSIPNPLSNLEFSNTVFYALLLFSIMLCIQIPILKTYYDKRIQL